MTNFIPAPADTYFLSYYLESDYVATFAVIGYEIKDGETYCLLANNERAQASRMTINHCDEGVFFCALMQPSGRVCMQDQAYPNIEVFKRACVDLRWG